MAEMPQEIALMIQYNEKTIPPTDSSMHANVI